MFKNFGIEMAYKTERTPKNALGNPKNKTESYEIY